MVSIQRYESGGISEEVGLCESALFDLKKYFIFEHESGSEIKETLLDVQNKKINQPNKKIQQPNIDLDFIVVSQMNKHGCKFKAASFFEIKLVMLAADVQILSVKTTKEKKAKTEIPIRERESMLKLIIGMAIDSYGYDPESNRNTLTGRKRGLSEMLETKGINNISPETIRKYLNEAKELSLHTNQVNKRS